MLGCHVGAWLLRVESVKQKYLRKVPQLRPHVSTQTLKCNFAENICPSQPAQKLRESLIKKSSSRCEQDIKQLAPYRSLAPLCGSYRTNKMHKIMLMFANQGVCISSLYSYLPPFSCRTGRQRLCLCAPAASSWRLSLAIALPLASVYHSSKQSRQILKAITHYIVWW